MQRAMCIWIPDWPLQRLALARTDLLGRTVVLYQASPQGGLKVVAATAALACPLDGFSTTETNAAGHLITGIYPGMPLGEAAALIAHAQQERQRKTPLPSRGEVGRGVKAADNPTLSLPSHSEGEGFEPHLEPADFEADRLGLVELADWCCRFSPIVGVEDAPCPDCLVLDVSGLAQLFGGEQALAEKALRAFHERGLSVRLAIADTPGAAWAVAHSEGFENVWRDGARPPAEPGAEGGESRGAGDESRGSFDSAGGASDKSPFIQVLPPGEAPTALAPLPVGYLRVADETVALLATLGICRIGQLAALPRSALLARFGPELLRRFDQAAGRAPEMIVARHAPPQHAADFTFEAPIANREAVEHVLRNLIARVTEPLARRREGALRLACRLKYERGFDENAPDTHLQFFSCHPQPPASPGGNPPTPGQSPGLRVARKTPEESLAFSLGLFRPSASPDYLCDLLRLRLESVRMAGPVTSVHVEVTAVAPLDLHQQALFDDETNRDRPRRLAGLIDRLSNRLGRGAVVQVMLLHDAQPEYTCVDVPLTGSGSPPLSISSPSAPGFAGGPRYKKPYPPAEPGAKGGKNKGGNGKGGANSKASKSNRRAKKNVAHISRYGLLSFAADERPLWLLPQPVRIEVLAIAPDGVPAQFRSSGQSYSIAQAWGPERIETGWWRAGNGYKNPPAEPGAKRSKNTTAAFVRRDYYRVETTAGARFWIFRQLDDRRWFLHGRFD
jgi:protein ImuB